MRVKKTKIEWNRVESSRVEVRGCDSANGVRRRRWVESREIDRGDSNKKKNVCLILLNISISGCPVNLSLPICVIRIRSSSSKVEVRSSKFEVSRRVKPLRYLGQDEQKHKGG